MYDALTGRFTFPCPARGETRVSLSAFRQLERLAGAAHPAVFQVLFACACGEEHEGLVTHDDLDWAPLGLQGGVFYNLMTARFDGVETELSDLAARRIQAGEWPWSFFCYPEERPRPVFPSSFFLLAPGDGSLGLAVRCPACQRTSVNLVSHQHVDVPWHNDADRRGGCRAAHLDRDPAPQRPRGRVLGDHRVDGRRRPRDGALAATRRLDEVGAAAALGARAPRRLRPRGDRHLLGDLRRGASPRLVPQPRDGVDARHPRE